VADRTTTGIELVPVDAVVGRRWVVDGAIARSAGGGVCVTGQF